MLIKIINPGEDYSDAMKVRCAVFVEEQGIPYENEADEYDKLSYHAVLYACGKSDVREPAACGRIYFMENNTAKIGRVAVLKQHRLKGFGRLICEKLIDTARENKIGEIVLHSQKHAAGFYEKLGFICSGEEFLEENIPHTEMKLRICN